MESSRADAKRARSDAPAALTVGLQFVYIYVVRRALRGT